MSLAFVIVSTRRTLACSSSLVPPRRFTQLAVHEFSLEAHGHPTVLAQMAEGGINNTDGSIRYVMLYPRSGLDSGVEYQVRPRNASDKYKWSIAESVKLAAN